MGFRGRAEKDLEVVASNSKVELDNHSLRDQWCPHIRWMDFLLKSTLAFSRPSQFEYNVARRYDYLHHRPFSLYPITSSCLEEERKYTTKSREDGLAIAVLQRDSRRTYKIN